jgi:TonB family protein
MRKVLVAALALSPVMLHAQATSPAQPQSSTVLESKLTTPNAIPGSASTAVAPVRVSTGVTAPKLIHVINVAPAYEDLTWRISFTEKTAVVSMLVDQNGVPSDLKIIRSVGSEMDKNVLAAVKEYRFQPGSLNHQPVAVPVNLEVTIQNAGR